MAMSRKPVAEQTGMRRFSILSFLIITPAYLWLLAAWLTR